MVTWWFGDGGQKNRIFNGYDICMRCQKLSEIQVSPVLTISKDSENMLNISYFPKYNVFECTLSP